LNQPPTRSTARPPRPQGRAQRQRVANVRQPKWWAPDAVAGPAWQLKPVRSGPTPGSGCGPCHRVTAVAAVAEGRRLGAPGLAFERRGPSRAQRPPEWPARAVSMVSTGMGAELVGSGRPGHTGRPPRAAVILSVPPPRRVCTQVSPWSPVWPRTAVCRPLPGRSGPAMLAYQSGKRRPSAGSGEGCGRPAVATVCTGWRVAAGAALRRPRATWPPSGPRNSNARSPRATVPTDNAPFPTPVNDRPLEAVGICSVPVVMYSTALPVMRRVTPERHPGRSPAMSTTSSSKNGRGEHLGGPTARSAARLTRPPRRSSRSSRRSRPAPGVWAGRGRSLLPARAPPRRSGPEAFATAPTGVPEVRRQHLVSTTAPAAGPLHQRPGEVLGFAHRGRLQRDTTRTCASSDNSRVHRLGPVTNPSYMVWNNKKNGHVLQELRAQDRSPPGRRVRGQCHQPDR